MEYTKFMRQPSIDMVVGIKVSKDTDIAFENDVVKQTIKGLVMRTVATVKGDTYESICDTTIQLKEGDVLIFEEDGRGYIKPVETFMTVEEAIEELECVKAVNE